mgnify:CR=1 FL=1
MKTNLTKEQLDLLKSLGTTVNINESESTFYYLPYWFEVKSDSTIEKYSFDKLPQVLKDAIIEMWV